MSMTDRIMRSRWFMPLFSLALGAIMFTAFAIGGDAGLGIQAFGVMAVLAAVFGFGSRRSETLAGLGGPGRDERWAMIDVHATAITGVIVILFVLGAWLYEVADGQDGDPWSLIAAVAGLTYVLAVAFMRWRS